jgi:hypothetical protein
LLIIPLLHIATINLDRWVTMYQIVHGTKGHMAVYGTGCHPQNIIWTEAKLRSIYYFVYNNKNMSSDRFACIEYNITNSSWHFGPNGCLWTGLSPTK